MADRRTELTAISPYGTMSMVLATLLTMLPGWTHGAAPQEGSVAAVLEFLCLSDRDLLMLEDEEARAMQECVKAKGAMRKAWAQGEQRLFVSKVARSGVSGAAMAQLSSKVPTTCEVYKAIGAAGRWHSKARTELAVATAKKAAIVQGIIDKMAGACLQLCGPSPDRTCSQAMKKIRKADPAISSDNVLETICTWQGKRLQEQGATPSKVLLLGGAASDTKVCVDGGSLFAKSLASINHWQPGDLEGLQQGGTVDGLIKAASLHPASSPFAAICSASSRGSSDGGSRGSLSDIVSDSVDSDDGGDLVISLACLSSSLSSSSLSNSRLSLSSRSSSLDSELSFGVVFGDQAADGSSVAADAISTMLGGTLLTHDDGTRQGGAARSSGSSRGGFRGSSSSLAITAAAGAACGGDGHSSPVVLVAEQQVPAEPVSALETGPEGAAPVVVSKAAAGIVQGQQQAAAVVAGAMPSALEAKAAPGTGAGSWGWGSLWSAAVNFLDSSLVQGSSAGSLQSGQGGSGDEGIWVGGSWDMLYV